MVVGQEVLLQEDCKNTEIVELELGRWTLNDVVGGRWTRKLSVGMDEPSDNSGPPVYLEDTSNWTPP